MKMEVCMKILRKAKKYEEVAEIFYVAKYEDRLMIMISFFRGEKIVEQKLIFTDISKLNEIYNKIIFDELVDITEYC